jgi:hypothetical protein
MKIYTVERSEDGKVISFHATKLIASKDCKTWRSRGVEDATVSFMELKPTREGIARLLNCVNPE